MSDSDRLRTGAVLEPLVERLLRERYGVVPGMELRVTSLSQNDQTAIFAIRPAGETAYRRLQEAAQERPPLPWVVRVYPPWRRPDRVQNDAAVLRLFERRVYPAPRVVPTTDGESHTTLDGAESSRAVLVTTYIEGEPTGLSLPGLRALGETLGRLHALPLDNDERYEIGNVLSAGMLPRNEVAAALSWLQDAHRQVQPALRRRCEELEGAWLALSLCEDASIPRVLIHNDCHPWNSVRTVAGSVVLIDWDGAGLGPAVVDLGFVLLSADTGGIIGPVIAPDAQRISALVEGYRVHHTLTRAELAQLPDAIRFRTLIAACGNFADAVKEGRAEEERPWYWQRYVMADEIADRARRLLG